MKDAYDILFAKYDKVSFFKDSIDEIIFVAANKVEINWHRQKELLLNNETLFIRGYGKDGKNTYMFKTLYKYLFKNKNIEKDSGNNGKPTQLLTELTGLCKITKIDLNNKERIQNYQVSHLFGRTKNPLLFTAAWNIAYIPKYLDPFTGHETQGKHKTDFQNIFTPKINSLFKTYIKDYNNFISERVNPSLENALLLTKKELKMPEIPFNAFKRSVLEELSEIKLPSDLTLTH